MKRKKRIKPSLDVETVSVLKVRLEHVSRQLALATEALEIINELDWSCSHGCGKSGFKLAGYIARTALEKVNH